MLQKSINSHNLLSFNFVTFELLLAVLTCVSDKQTQFVLKYSIIEPRVKSSLLPLYQNWSNFRALICISPSFSSFSPPLASGGEAKTYYPPEGWSTVSLYQKRCDERGRNGSRGVQCCDQSEITKS